MFTFPPDLWIWLLSLLFGAFCVWNACRITSALGTAASQQAANAGGALDLHIGSWLRIATQSPAVAFFVLGIAAGIGLPAFYSYLYSPDGPKGTDTVTARGRFNPAVASVCFQTDSVVSSAAGYTLKFPRKVHSVNYSVQTASAIPASLFIELNGDSASYSIDNGPSRTVTIDHEGVLPIGDPITLQSSAGSNALTPQSATGSQTTSLSQVLLR